MSGHSKWSTIKHKKGAQDASAARFHQVDQGNHGGGPDGRFGRSKRQPRLMDRSGRSQGGEHAQGQYRAGHQEGYGRTGGVNYEESVYEGYGPGGAAVLVESLTDNKNRAVADIRHIFAKCGGNKGENGCVAWMFDKKGYFCVDKDAVNEDTLMEVALDAGAEDVREDEGVWEVITEPSEFEKVRQALDKAKIPYSDEEVTMLPQNTADLQGKEAEQMLRMMDMLDDCEDVQKVYTNADIPDDIVDAA